MPPDGAGDNRLAATRPQGMGIVLSCVLTRKWLIEEGAVLTQIRSRTTKSESGADEFDYLDAMIPIRPD